MAADAAVAAAKEAGVATANPIAAARKLSASKHLLVRNDRCVRVCGAVYVCVSGYVIEGRRRGLPCLTYTLSLTHTLRSSSSSFNEMRHQQQAEMALDMSKPQAPPQKQEPEQQQQAQQPSAPAAPSAPSKDEEQGAKAGMGMAAAS